MRFFSLSSILPFNNQLTHFYLVTQIGNLIYTQKNSDSVFNSVDVSNSELAKDGVCRRR